MFTWPVTVTVCLSTTLLQLSHISQPAQYGSLKGARRVFSSESTVETSRKKLSLAYNESKGGAI